MAYSPAPRRHYKLRKTKTEQLKSSPLQVPMERTLIYDWLEVPSVTSVLGVLEKPQLVWWGQGVGVDGVLELVRRGRLKWVFE